MMQSNWTGLMSIGCLLVIGGCGGRTAMDDLSNSESLADASCTLPPSGFYSMSVETLTDSCDPPRSQVVGKEMGLAAASQGCNVIIGLGGPRQDVPWEGLPKSKFPLCDTTWQVDVIAKSCRSFQIEYAIDWVNPTTCGLSTMLDIPPSNCFVRQRETFELIKACPATNSAGVSCK
jgi:hypothetical protein